MDNALYCLYDVVACQWLAPFIAATRGAAIRMIDNSFKGSKVDPHDFKLMRICDWFEGQGPDIGPLGDDLIEVVKDYTEGQKVLKFNEDIDGPSK